MSATTHGAVCLDRQRTAVSFRKNHVSFFWKSSNGCHFSSGIWGQSANSRQLSRARETVATVRAAQKSGALSWFHSLTLNRYVSLTSTSSRILNREFWAVSCSLPMCFLRVLGRSCPRRARQRCPRRCKVDGLMVWYSSFDNHDTCHTSTASAHTPSCSTSWTTHPCFSMLQLVEAPLEGPLATDHCWSTCSVLVNSRSLLLSVDWIHWRWYLFHRTRPRFVSHCGCSGRGSFEFCRRGYSQ